MADTTKAPAAKRTPAKKKEATGRHFTPRKPLTKKDEKRLEAVTAAFEGDSTTALKWAEAYGRKVLKHAAGLRATAAPIPPELGAEKAAKVREILGIAAEESKNGGEASAA